MSAAERQDLSLVLNFLKKLPAVDSSSVGIIGSSQGGLHALWAAADMLNVKAVASDAILPDWAEDVLSNGSIRQTMLPPLNSPGVRYAPIRDTLWNLVRAGMYDSLAVTFTQGRNVDTSQSSFVELPLHPPLR